MRSRKSAARLLDIVLHIMRVHIVAVLALIALATNTVIDIRSAEANDGYVKLTGSQIERVFAQEPGIAYPSDGSEGDSDNWDLTINGNGTWDGLAANADAHGTWKITGNALCIEIRGVSAGSASQENSPIEGCFDVYMDRHGKRVAGAFPSLGQNRFPLLEEVGYMASIIFSDKESPEKPAPVDSAKIDTEKVDTTKVDTTKDDKQLEQEKLIKQLQAEVARAKAQLKAGQNNTRSRSELKRETAEQGPTLDIQFGTYHAIVIGIDDYKTLPKLQTAVTDARAVAKTLETLYDFQVQLLENPTRADIIDTFDEYRENLTENDNLLVYYAGHGWLDKAEGRGYWLPVNAKENRRSRWIANEDLTAALKAIFAKHVIVVSDSCYSGTLTRSIKPIARSPNYLKEMTQKRARVALSSGGLEPVIDSGGGQHSVFAAQFLKALRENRTVMDGVGLYQRVRQAVLLNAKQTPQYSDIRFAGHEGGDFLFVRKN